MGHQQQRLTGLRSSRTYTLAAGALGLQAVVALALFLLTGLIVYTPELYPHLSEVLTLWGTLLVSVAGTGGAGAGAMALRGAAAAAGRARPKVTVAPHEEALTQTP